MRRISRSCGRSAGVISVLLIAALLSCIFGGVTTSAAEQYDPKEAGHPLKILAYVVFPIGVLFDYALMRPAFWIVQKEPAATIFGYDYMSDEEGEATPRSVEGVLDENQTY